MENTARRLICLAYNPNDHRFQNLAIRATASTVRLKNGELSALTFLFRIDACGEGGVAFSVHTSAPLSVPGQKKFEELLQEIRVSLASAVNELPTDISLLAENAVWVTVDVLHGSTQTASRAAILADFDFTRSTRAIEWRRKRHKEQYAGPWANLKLYFSAFTEDLSAFSRAGTESARVCEVDERNRPAADAAAEFNKDPRATAFRKALQEQLGAQLARIYAAHLTPEIRAEIVELGRDPGRLTRADYGEGVTATPDPEPLSAHQQTPTESDRRLPTIVCLEEAPTEKLPESLSVSPPLRPVVPVTRRGPALPPVH